MNLRLARPDDAAAMEAFLACFAESSMFLRDNLARHGIGASDHPHATTFWLWDSADGLRGVLGRTNAGYLMAQAPGAPRALWRNWAAELAGQRIQGMTGDDVQVRSALRALALRVDDFATNAAEPLYRLNLVLLDPPEHRIAPARIDDVPMLRTWFEDYALDTGLAVPGRAAQDQADQRAWAAAQAGSPVRLLIVEGQAVAMAAINAQVGDMVQVGGVFVPRAARNRGLARLVTAHVLDAMRAQGAKTAILFANNPAAARAYEAIGFERIGAYRVSVLKQPVTVELSP